MRAPYLYSGLEAGLYDQLDELSEFHDVEFYVELARESGGPVLDLGCGTGRVMIPLLESGAESVTGLEFSEEMLEQCREGLEVRALDGRLVKGDMRDFDFGEERFELILIPGFSFQMLLEDEELLGCLACCRRHLAEGGMLVVSSYLPWDMIWAEEDESFLEERCRVLAEAEGESWVAYQGWRLDRERQRLELRNRIEREAADGSISELEEKGMTLRWDLPHEMLDLLEQAGFRNVELRGDFSDEPPDAESEAIAYLARVGE